MAEAEGAGCVVISAEIEAELAQLPDDEQPEFLETLGLEEPGLDRLIRAGYDLLGLHHLFTAGPKEVRAWTIHEGDPRAAGGRRHPHRFREGLHPRPDHRLSTTTSRSAASRPAKEAGKARDEGKEYVVKDGDVMLFKFNV